MLPGIAGCVGGLNATSVAAPSHPLASLFSGGTAGGLWDLSVSSSLWQDLAGTTPVTSDGDPILRIDDLSGNGNHLLRATSGQEPHYKPNSGKPYALFGGASDNDYLKAVFAMGTTWDRVSAFQVPTHSGLDERFYGSAANQGLDFCADGFERFLMLVPLGSGPNSAAGIALNTDYVITERWANPCQFAIDNGSYVSSPSIAAINPGGITVAAQGSSTSPSNFANMKLFGLLMINRALTGPEIATVRTYMGALQGRSL